MGAFYNEFEPFAAAWLRELIKAGEIADGEVSEKDMWDVVPGELMGFNQVHLCAGIGGWSAALRLAGWPDDKPVWTVSLPCQSFSAAGKGNGLADERGQLAEAFFWLAGICRPVCIFGEQVEAAIKHDWWDVMASQLESIGYTVGAVGFPASSVGAFHLRQRLYWVADNKGGGWGEKQSHSGGVFTGVDKKKNETGRHLPSGPACCVADAENTNRRSGERGEETGTWTDGERRRGSSSGGSTGILADADGRDSSAKRVQRSWEQRLQPEGVRTGILGDSERQGCWRLENEQGAAGDKARGHATGSGAANFWSDAIWIPCSDGKARPTKPGIFPLANGVPNRVGTLRGAGNAIVPQAAAEFIMAFINSKRGN